MCSLLHNHKGKLPQALLCMNICWCTDSAIWYILLFFFSSVQFSPSVVSDSLRPHEPQHARHPCPSPTPGVHPNPCPLSWWYHPTISSYRPLLLPPSIFTSIRVFSNESVLHVRWPKYWSFSFNRQNSGPPKMSMSWSLEPVNMFPYMAEQILQRWWRILRWGNYLGLSKWAQYNHRVIIKERGR